MVATLMVATRTSMRLLLALVLLVSPAAPFVAHPAVLPTRRRGYQPAHRPDVAVLTRHAPSRRSGDDPRMFPGGGNFLNLGTPEMFVIGAVAWALLGPKELYRIAQEAGKFLGEWQQLGQNAKNTFTEAIEAEMRVDEDKKRADEEKVAAAAAGATTRSEEAAAEPVMASTMADAPAATSAEELGKSWYDEIPSLDEYQEQRKKAMEDAPPLTGLSSEDPFAGSTEEEQRAFMESLEDMTGGLSPDEATSKFQSQLSGDANRKVLDEFPPELNVEEDMLQTRIQQAENDLAMLQTEQKVLDLRRQQQEANALRTARERELETQLAASADEQGPKPEE